MSAEFNDFDRFAMQRALELAARGLETTHPNPHVGCVIARRERIVGEGWHERAGEPHAEVIALRAAGSNALGATAYVTLEPCSHHGRTPPCVAALVEAKVSRVVFAVHDPNPLVNGEGAKALHRAGITVQSGLMEAEATALNAGFIKRMQHGRPWVRVKSAMSLDGRTALANGESQWITGEAARDDVQRLRARSSAILTGIGTLLADDPQLTVRIGGEARQPLRVILDTRLRTPPGARLFETQGDVLILTTANFAASDVAARAAALEKCGARIEAMSSAQPENNVQTRWVDLQAALARLAELEVNEVLVEAGPTLSGEFVRQSLADEVIIYVAPTLLGPTARALLELPRLAELSAAQRLEFIDAIQIGGDLRLRLRPPAKP
jgi:diaminohydroxyphosphoribosylaminopyrimidine deaminase/5-amino-6-(5-phosphoribosylamino)uracil reductase